MGTLGLLLVSFFGFIGIIILALISIFIIMVVVSSHNINKTEKKVEEKFKNEVGNNYTKVVTGIASKFKLCFDDNRQILTYIDSKETRIVNYNQIESANYSLDVDTHKKRKNKTTSPILAGASFAAIGFAYMKSSTKIEQYSIAKYFYIDIILKDNLEPIEINLFGTRGPNERDIRIDTGIMKASFNLACEKAREIGDHLGKIIDNQNKD